MTPADLAGNRACRPEIDAAALAERLQDVFGRLWSAHRRHQTTRATAGGLSSAQLAVLSSVIARGPMRVSDLAVLLQVRAPSVTVGVDRLMREGLVTRSSSGSDHREVYICITDRGNQLYRTTQDSRSELAVAALGVLCEQERESLRRALPVLEAVVGPLTSGDDTHV